MKRMSLVTISIEEAGSKMTTNKFILKLIEFYNEFLDTYKIEFVS
jgi:hypothetical protein